MNKINIKPIDIKKAPDAKGVWKNVTDVVDFQISLANELNRVISETGNHTEQPKLISTITEYDDSHIKNEIASNRKEAGYKIDVVEQKLNKLIESNELLSKDLKSKIKSVETLVDRLDFTYDDSSLSERISNLSERKSAAYDDAQIKSKIKDLTAMIEDVYKIISPEYDDTKLKESGVLLDNKLNALHDGVRTLMSESLSSKKEIDSNRKEAGYKIDVIEQKFNKLIESKIKPQYDDTKIKESVVFLTGKLQDSKKELNDVKMQSLSSKKEIESNRKEAGYKIDVLEQKINKLMENK